MMAGTTDNGGCGKLELKFNFGPRRKVAVGATDARQAEEEREGLGGYLRKTARGASSPAKPALHIPDLIIDQHGKNELNGRVERWKAGREARTGGGSDRPEGRIKREDRNQKHTHCR